MTDQPRNGDEANRRKFLRTVGAAGLVGSGLVGGAAASGRSCQNPNAYLYADDFDPNNVTVGDTVTFVLYLEVSPDRCLRDDPNLNKVRVEDTYLKSGGSDDGFWKIALIAKFDEPGEFNVFADVPLVTGETVTTNTVEVSVSRKGGIKVRNPRLVVSRDRKTATGRGKLKNNGSKKKTVKVDLWEKTSYDPLETKSVTVYPYQKKEFEVSAATRDYDGFGKLGLSVDGDVVATDIP